MVPSMTRVRLGVEDRGVFTIAIVARPRTIVGDLHFNIDVMDQALDAAERHDDRWAQTRILSNNPIYRLLVRPDTDMFAQFDRAIELAAGDGDEPGELLADAVAAQSVAAVSTSAAPAITSPVSMAATSTTGCTDTTSSLADMLIANMSGNYADVHRLVREHIDRFPTVYRAFAAQLLGWAAWMTQNTEWLHTARSLLPGEREHGAYTTAATHLRAYDAAFAATTPAPSNSPSSPTHDGLPADPSRHLWVQQPSRLWCDDLDTARAISDQTHTRTQCQPRLSCSSRRA